MKRRYKRLTHDNRIQIETLLRQGVKPYRIAKLLGFAHSSIYREINRSRYTHLNEDYTTERRYSADKGDYFARFNRTTQGRQPKIENDYEFAKFVERMILIEKKSPSAVLMYIKRNNLHFRTEVCLSTLYNYIRKGMFLHVTEKDLWKKGKRKKKRSITVSKRKRSLYGNSIEQRPNEATARAFGHWEMDSVIGKRESGETLLTFTERKTRFEIIIKSKDKTAASTIKAINSLERIFGSAFSKVFKTITCDNGVEFSASERIETSPYTKKKRTTLYYCHPYSSWERGSNENQNGFIRRFIPKGTKMETISQSKLKRIQDFINQYPRALFDGDNSENQFKREIKALGVSLPEKFF